MFLVQLTIFKNLVKISLKRPFSVDILEIFYVEKLILNVKLYVMLSLNNVIILVDFLVILLNMKMFTTKNAPRNVPG